MDSSHYGSNNSPPTPLSVGGIRLFLLVMVLGTGLVFSFLACSPGEKATGAPKLTAPVTVATVIEKDMPVALKAIGSVEAFNTVSIRARIGGALTRVAFREGQDITQGSLLFVIDSRPYEQTLQAALAALERDQAQLKNAEAEVRRYAELIKEEYVTKQQYDQITTNAEALRNTVLSDKAVVENARLNLQYCRILSPLNGRTGSLMVHEGDQIKADDIAMVVINQITPIKANFSLPEQYLPDLRKYSSAGSLSVEANFSAGRDRPIRGKLTFIDNAVDLATRTILLKATFPNTDLRLWPGQFVNITVTLTTRPHVLVIPSQALQTGQQGTFVFVVGPDLTAESRSVAPGQEVNGETIIEKGLQRGDRVVTDGQLRLVPGTKVQIQPSPDSRTTEPS